MTSFSLPKMGLATAAFLAVGALTASAQTREIEISAAAGLRFDPPRFAVEPGQSVELTFSNPDTMLHNLLIVAPGAREEVAAMAMALGANGAESQYVPDSDKVLVHTRLLSHRESQVLTFRAPDEEGVYPYVCTFPGHSAVMYGAMYVTRDPMPPLADDPHMPDQVRFAADNGASSHEPAQANAAVGNESSAEDLIRHLEVPEGFEAVLFARPPEVNYPTCLASSADGRVLYVGVDRNGSLGRREDRGFIVRAEDTTNDGRADTFSTFARVDSPRGIVWDGDAVYVLHPPDITRFRDTTGDGEADESDRLVSGIGYGINHPRGADHSTNGLRMGIDGWLYVSVGDFGFDRAVGADGVELELLGGGVVRVRPDGSEMELVASGLRNIYDTAISPSLDILVRDNDNDGDEWDTRLQHIITTAEYGYPYYFTNFADEILSPIAHYGSGSPTGAFYLDEPGWPENLNDRLYTAEWNRDLIERHVLSAAGAGFTEEAREPFLGIPSPTGLVTDGRSGLFVASWHGGGFNYGGPDVGFVVRISPEDYPAPRTPDFATLDSESLVAYLGSSSSALRGFAQREILRRGESENLANGLTQLVSDRAGDRAVRVAALFTLKQLLGRDSHDLLIGLTGDETIREFALRALADRIPETDNVPSAPFVAALDDNNPRVRLQAVIGIGRLARTELGTAVAENLTDSDPRVAHAAEKSLIRLEAQEAAFEAFDNGGDALHGARRVLQALHRDRVVDGLIRRLESDEPTRAVRRATFVALARLYHKEASGWTPPEDWWGTQPDRRGPYYRPTQWERSDDIARSLRRALDNADAGSAEWLRAQLQRHRIPPEDLANNL